MRGYAPSTVEAPGYDRPALAADVLDLAEALAGPARSGWSGTTGARRRRCRRRPCAPSASRAW